MLGSNPPNIQTFTQWPLDSRVAYYSQTTIGWKHVLYSRLAKGWDAVGTDIGAMNSLVQTLWTGTIIKHLWSFGLDIWSLHNKLVHGIGRGISWLEPNRVTSLIINVLYAELYPMVEGPKRTLFEPGLNTKVQMSFQCQCAWWNPFM